MRSSWHSTPPQADLLPDFIRVKVIMSTWKAPDDSRIRMHEFILWHHFSSRALICFHHAEHQRMLCALECALLRFCYSAHSRICMCLGLASCSCLVGAA